MVHGPARAFTLRHGCQEGKHTLAKRLNIAYAILVRGLAPSPTIVSLFCSTLVPRSTDYSIRTYVSLRRKRAASPDSPMDHDVFSAAQKNFDLCVAAANHITTLGMYNVSSNSD